jgi:hypothetical protein
VLYHMFIVIANSFQELVSVYETAIIDIAETKRLRGKVTVGLGFVQGH